MKMTDMALPKEKRKTLSKIAADETKGPRYPWGLELGLDDASLQKLGKTSADFASGEFVWLVCKAKVQSVATRDIDSKKSASVDLQIVSMTMETKQDRVSKAFDKAFGDGS